MDERRWAFDRVALVARILVIVTIMSHFSMSCLLRFLRRAGAACEPAVTSRVTSPSICRLKNCRSFYAAEIICLIVNIIK